MIKSTKCVVLLPVTTALFRSINLRPVKNVVATCISISYNCDTGIFLDALSPVVTSMARRTTSEVGVTPKRAKPLYGCCFLFISAFLLTFVVCRVAHEDLLPHLKRCTKSVRFGNCGRLSHGRQETVLKTMFTNLLCVTVVL